MAVIKAVSSKAKIGTAIRYICKKEKTDECLIGGLNCSKETAEEEMQATKDIWNKNGGRTYKHFVQSFSADEHIKPEQAHEIARQFAEQCKLFDGFEVLYATHKDREHIHTHFIVNSVNFEDGHKFHMSADDLQEMKNLSDKLCREHSLSITKKGKTFDGEEREETSAYNKDLYRLLKASESNAKQSYIQDIALAVMSVRERSTSRQEFVKGMLERGYGVNWTDNHKNITFVDLARQEQGERKCKVRNSKLEQYYNIDFSKEGLEREFEENLQRTKRERAIDNAYERASNSRAYAINARARANDKRAEANDRLIRTDNSADERQSRELERERLAIERRQKEIEERRRAEERERIRTEKIRTSKGRSR